MSQMSKYADVMASLQAWWRTLVEICPTAQLTSVFTSWIIWAVLKSSLKQVMFWASRRTLKYQCCKSQNRLLMPWLVDDET